MSKLNNLLGGVFLSMAMASGCSAEQEKITTVEPPVEVIFFVLDVHYNDGSNPVIKSDGGNIFEILPGSCVMVDYRNLTGDNKNVRGAIFSDDGTEIKIIGGTISDFELFYRIDSMNIRPDVIDCKGYVYPLSP